MTAVKCLYCDVALTRTEMEEGWCESCGKRLPASLVRREAPPPVSSAAPPVASAAPQTPPAEGGFAGRFAITLVCGVMGVILAAVLTNGRFISAGGMVGGMIGIILTAAVRAGRS